MTGFSRPSFNPMMGQEFITSYDEGQSSDVPNLYTSVDQGPAATTVPGLVTQQDLYKSPSSTPSTDWGKVLQEMVKAGSATYAGYTKTQIAEAAAKQKAGLPTGLPKVVPEPSGISPNTVFLVGGLAAAVIIAVIAAS